MTNGSFLQRLLSIISCTCGRHYEAEDVSVLGQQGELWFVSVSCPSCGIQSLVAAVDQKGTPAEVSTDLTEEKCAKFAQGALIGWDDVLDMHNLLKDFHGDIAELLTER